MKKLLSLFLIVACSIACSVAMQAIGLNVGQMKITKFNPPSEKVITALPESASSKQFDIVSDKIAGAATAPFKAAAAASADEWLPFGTVYFNDAFNSVFSSNYTAENQLDVYVSVLSDYEWNLKIVNLLGADIIVKAHLRQGTMTIEEQQTGIKSPFADNGADYYPCYSLYMFPADASPFSGTIDMSCYALLSPNSGYDLTDAGFKMTLTVGQEWQKFGTATPNASLIQTFALYGATVEDKAYEVDYLKLSNELWVFMLRDFVGADVPIVSYIDKRVSVGVSTPLAARSPYYEDNGSYEYYHLTSYFAGSPRDGEMWFPFWLMVDNYSGINLSDSNQIMTFVSEILSSFKVIDTTDRYISDKDNGIVTLNVERSDNVSNAQVEVLSPRYNLETGAGQSVTLFKGSIAIAPDNSIRIPVGNVRGLYYIRMLGLDNSGPFGTQRNIKVYANTSDGHTWESVGTGLFKPYSYEWCWEGTSPWLDVEIEKATDAEGLYRAVNPFRSDVIMSKIADSFTYYDKMDTYVYFGENNDYTLPQHIGFVSLNNDISCAYIFPSSNYDATNGIYDLNIGEFTLPGINNYGIKLTSPTTARVSPHVEDVIYSLIPVSAALDHDYGTDEAQWLVSGVSDIRHASPDAEQNVTFDNSECAGSVHLIAIATLDENHTKQVYRHSLVSDGEGWIEVGKLNVSQLSTIFTDGEQTETVYAKVSVNPFERVLIKVDNPFKEINVRTEDYTTDFSVDRSIYFKSSPAGYVSSCSKEGEVMEVGGETGIFDKYDGDSFPPEFTEADILNAIAVRFECETNVLYRSGYDDKRIAQLLAESSDFAVPVRFGSLLVFPEYGAKLYSYFRTSTVLNEFCIFAPTDVTRDYALSEIDSDTRSFTVGADIAAVKLYSTETSAVHPKVYDILTKDYESIDLTVAEGKATADLPVGMFDYTAVAYDKEGKVANCVKGQVNITSGIDNIITDDNAAEPVYYNLQGVRVDNPEAGIYIVRRGNKVAKELVK